MCEDEKQIKSPKLCLEEIFSELGNIGVGSCMASLSHIIRQEVRYSKPKLVNTDYESMSADLGRADENVAGVLVNYSGDIEGRCLIIFKASMAGAIAEGVLGENKKLQEFDGRMLDLLKEAANLMVSSYLASVSSYASCRLYVESAAVTSDMAGAILAEAAAGMTDRAVCIETLFGTVPDQEDSFMMAVMYESSVSYFLKALEVEACVGS